MTVLWELVGHFVQENRFENGPPLTFDNGVQLNIEQHPNHNVGRLQTLDWKRGGDF